MPKWNPARERGATMASFLVTFMAILLMAALVVDLAPAYIAKTRQQNMLSQAAQQLTAPSQSLLVKNSANPGREVMAQLTASLRSAGFEGRIEVWYYEPGSSVRPEVDDANRVFAYMVRVTSTSQATVGLLMGTSDFEVSSAITGSANPYAQVRVWRPSTVQCGLWTIEAGQGASQATFEGIQYPNMPAELKSELDAELSRI